MRLIGRVSSSSSLCTFPPTGRTKVLHYEIPFRRTSLRIAVSRLLPGLRFPWIHPIFQPWLPMEAATYYSHPLYHWATGDCFGNKWSVIGAPPNSGCRSNTRFLIIFKEQNPTSNPEQSTENRFDCNKKTETVDTLRLGFTNPCSTTRLNIILMILLFLRSKKKKNAERPLMVVALRLPEWATHSRAVPSWRFQKLQPLSWYSGLYFFISRPAILIYYGDSRSARKKPKKNKIILKALNILVDTFGTIVPNVSTSRKIRYADRGTVSTRWE